MLGANHVAYLLSARPEVPFPPVVFLSTNKSGFSQLVNP